MVTPETLAAAGRVVQLRARMAMLAARAMTANDLAPAEPLADGADGTDERSKTATRGRDEWVGDATAS